MTMRELAEYRWLRREIDTLEHRLCVLETSALAPASPKLTDAPRGRNADSVAGYVVRSEELNRILRSRRTQAKGTLLRLERFIAEVPDSLDRQIITLRFVDGCSWTRVAALLGGGNTPEGVRKRVQRCLAAMQTPLGGSRKHGRQK